MVPLLTLGTAPPEGDYRFFKILRAEREVPENQPLTAWWEIQGFLTTYAENVEGPTPQFQLPAATAPSAQ